MRQRDHRAASLKHHVIRDRVELPAGQGAELPGVVAFGASLVLLSLSLLYSLYEIQISTNAINVELSNFEARKSAGREDVDYS